MRLIPRGNSRVLKRVIQNIMSIRGTLFAIDKAILNLEIVNWLNLIVKNCMCPKNLHCNTNARTLSKMLCSGSSVKNALNSSYIEFQNQFFIYN